MRNTWLVLVVLCAWSIKTANGCCENKCSGHGSCSVGCTCVCHAQWTGSDCSERQCPSGLQWVGDASATDQIHTTSAVCSNVGKCDTGSGICQCQAGFEGLACERLKCPLSCNYHGRCISLKEAAKEQDDLNFFRKLTYTGWEANRIFGCQCELGWTGYDCSLRECPKGDDPLTTGQDDEIQTISCQCDTTCTGSVYLSFLGEVTGAIPHDASAAVIKAALEDLKSIRTVSVSNGGSLCTDGSASDTTVTFTHDHGDVPIIRVRQNDMTTSGTTMSFTIAETTPGTKENEYCSGRGECDFGTGLCTCEVEFSASDGLGASGIIGDCGYESGTASACPNSCSGHGTCSGATDYRCTCDEGYLGFDCSQRTCAVGTAWFSEPGESLPGLVSVTASSTSVTTTADLTGYLFEGDVVVIDMNQVTVSSVASGTVTITAAYPGTTVTDVEAVAHPDRAHHEVECSGRGLCNRQLGLCVCMNGFTGSSCQKTICPSDCSGRGVCISNERFATLTESNGDATSYTYGADPSNKATWDHNMLHGCKCDKSVSSGGLYDYMGHDCSLLACQVGDDPSTIGVDEVQTLSCDHTGGTFTLTFRQQTTASIDFDATASELKSAIEAMSTVGTVSVAITGSTLDSDPICGAGPIETTITFETENGNLPEMTVTSALTGGSTAQVAQTTAGTKEVAECSNHGICDRATGACECFSGYVSSDGLGSPGTRGDCSARDALYTK